MHTYVEFDYAIPSPRCIACIHSYIFSCDAASNHIDFPPCVLIENTCCFFAVLCGTGHTLCICYKFNALPYVSASVSERIRCPFCICK